jgi:D-alanyl-lipoteichoic acid acyltransferase DltB (MBOAT superfamily)
LLFPTIDFAIFFGIVFVLNWLLAPFPRRWKPFIIVASYFFYAWWDWKFIFLLMASTAITIVGGKLIHSAPNQQLRKTYLIAALVGDLGLLAYFKYYGFFAFNLDNFVHTLGLHSHPVPLAAVTLPIGISFFTFMAISYVVDIYKGKLEPARPVDVAVYLSFFPHLIAGPIVRGSELLPQIDKSGERDPRKIEMPRAAYLIFGGLFKKVVLSSYISTAIVDPVFANPKSHSSLEILFAIYGYAVQIYCDFSGYTDIAIGCALLLGFKFPQNFNAPYTARSLQDFWRRWHMTLSFWLRDYLYIPLGGSRGSQAMMYRNIMITMMLGGLWHGAGWTFIIWGTLQGVGQCFGHYKRKWREDHGLAAQADGRWAVAWQRFATFQYVCLGWVFFRAVSFSSAMTILGRLFTAWDMPSPLVTFPVLLVIAIGIGTQYVPPTFGPAVQRAFSQLGRLRNGILVQGGVLAAILLAITTLGPAGVAPFIYFRF